MKQIDHIFCTVLGKPDSHLAVTKAIDLALDHDARLTFVTVLNADFMSVATPVMTSLSVVYNQLRELGEFTMSILCEQAKRRGVKDVDFIIREGKMIPQLHQLITEIRPDVFVLGRPIGRGKPVFSVSPEEIDRFLAEIETDYHIAVETIVIENNTNLEGI